MDPNETWKQMLDAYSQSNWDEAVELAEALLAWLRRGGFPPKTTIVSSDGTVMIELDNDQANRQIADAVARSILLSSKQKQASV